MNCPNCGAENAVTIRPGLSAKQIGEFSLAGQQMKVSARTVAIAECSSCDLYLTGRVEGATLAEDGHTFTGGHFVVEIPGESGIIL